MFSPKSGSQSGQETCGYGTNDVRALVEAPAAWMSEFGVPAIFSFVMLILCADGELTCISASSHTCTAVGGNLALFLHCFIWVSVTGCGYSAIGDPVPSGVFPPSFLAQPSLGQLGPGLSLPI